MNLNDFKNHLQNLEELSFRLPDGNRVPKHFHITEIGKIRKDYIDCGGQLRNEEKISLQLFEANDYGHRLPPGKLLKIVEMASAKLSLKNVDIEVEYQGISINKFNLDFQDDEFLLVNTKTDCMAKDKCGIPAKPKPRIRLSDLQNGVCVPDSGCC